MSNMLDQAIIDAEALKEAAIKNAEATIVEKYSKDIKKAVNQLLEQEGAAPPPSDAANGCDGRDGRATWNFGSSRRHGRRRRYIARST